MSEAPPASLAEAKDQLVAAMDSGDTVALAEAAAWISHFTQIARAQAEGAAHARVTPAV